MQKIDNNMLKTFTRRVEMKLLGDSIDSPNMDHTGKMVEFPISAAELARAHVRIPKDIVPGTSIKIICIISAPAVTSTCNWQRYIHCRRLGQMDDWNVMANDTSMSATATLNVTSEMISTIASGVEVVADANVAFAFKPISNTQLIRMQSAVLEYTSWY